MRLERDENLLFYSFEHYEDEAMYMIKPSAHKIQNEEEQKHNLEIFEIKVQASNQYNCDVLPERMSLNKSELFSCSNSKEFWGI